MDQGTFEITALDYIKVEKGDSKLQELELKFKFEYDLEAKRLELDAKKAEAEAKKAEAEASAKKAEADAKALVEAKRMELEAESKEAEAEANAKALVETKRLELEAEANAKKAEAEIEAKRIEAQNETKRIEAQNEAKRIEADLRKAELVADGRPRVDTFDPSKVSKLVPRFVEKDVDDYFNHFEKVASNLKWPKEYWPSLPQTVFVGKAREAYTALPDDKCNDYDNVKQAVLKAYELVPEAYR